MKTNYTIFQSLCCVLLLVGSCTTPEEVADPPPNILWIIAEDLSPDLACYGHSLVKTPNIDGLARRGVRYTQAFTAAPVCAPSRTALAVGMYQTAINAHHMRYPDSLKNELPADIIPLNELLRRQGYRTANIKDAPGRGKGDWSFRSDLVHYDTDRWDELQADKPFFAVVNLRLTHRPFERDTINPIDPANVDLPPYYPDDPVVRRDWAQYLETVQVMDQLVGEVLREVELRGWADNTIVFYFSDHGRPMTRGKNYHYDSGYHIPLVISSPETLDWHRYLPVGTTDDRLVSAIDLSATTLAMSVADKPTWMQGRILLGKQAEPERQYVFCASDRIGGTFFKTRSVRSKRYKYIRNFNHDFSVNSSATAYRKQMHPIYHVLNIYNEMGKLTPAQKALVDPMPEELLFDLAADPFEVNNLIADSSLVVVAEEMRAALKNWQTSTYDYGMEPDSEGIIQSFADYRVTGHRDRFEKINTLEKTIRAEIIKRYSASPKDVSN
ncbi:MAG: sulfatase [Saprospiraceae bacterium]|nr:sulfatase [Saprospiraceae bacterium]